MNLLRLFQRRRPSIEDLERQKLENEIKLSSAEVKRVSNKNNLWSILFLMVIAYLGGNLLGKYIQQQNCVAQICAYDESQKYTNMGYGALDESKPISNVFWYRYHSAFTSFSSARFTDVALSLRPRLQAGDVFVIDINSHGGDATACGSDYETVMDLRRSGIKIVAVIDDNALSCGYYLASAADLIYSSKSANVGNIGVYISMQQPKQAKDKLVVGSTRTKELFGGAIPGGLDDVEILRSYVLDAYKLFVSNVEQNRGALIKDKGRAYSGMPFIGVTALELGLVDKNMTSEQLRALLHKTNHRVVALVNTKPKSLQEMAIDIALSNQESPEQPNK